MNSYNENLQATVFASLQALELEQKNVKAQLDAATLTLFYAEGARITAAENLIQDNSDYTYKQTVLNEAVVNSNISANLLGTANLQKTTVAQSVTNAAVSAANVQIAANAVLRLASDMGSIFSIVSAADYGTDIYAQAQEAYELMNKTAYDAEFASQISMEASTLMAEVSSATVASMAKTTNDAMTAFLQVVNQEFQAISTVVAADTATLATASNTEKAAEGILESTNAEYASTNKAYQINNKELNLDLLVKLDPKSPTEYKVSFDAYKSPFNEAVTQAGDPVQQYYIFLVKSSKQTVFNLSAAENILQLDDHKKRLHKVPMPVKNHTVQTIVMSELNDADGEPMQLGQEYVVFLFATFTERYKKAINTFDDYLSAPSAPFTLSYTLNAVTGSAIKVEGGKEEVQQLKFTVSQNIEYPVEYRLMFLPFNKSLTTGLLTANDLKKVENDVTMAEKIASELDPQISMAQSDLNTLTAQMEELDTQISEVTETMNNATGANKRKARTELNELQSKEKQLRSKIRAAHSLINRLVAEKKARMNAIQQTAHGKLGFFFNLTIAEQITAGNYTVVPVKAGATPSNSLVAPYSGSVVFKPEMTDVFGNRLEENMPYIPAILSASVAEEDVLAQFTDSLSDFNQTASFIYKTTKLLK